MKVCDSLAEKLIIPNLRAKNKIDCLMECAEVIETHCTGLRKDDVAHTLFEREKLGSTGIQDGIAIPHGKIHGLKTSVVLFARSLEGLDFQSYDGKPTLLFFVLLAPEEANSDHLKLLARLSRLMKNAKLRERLLKAGNAGEIYRLLCEEDEKLA